MRNGPCNPAVKRAWKLLPAVALSLGLAAPGHAQEASASAAGASPAAPAPISLDRLLTAVVHIKTFITPDGRTTENLGKQREGTGIVIDSNGLVLTIGYLMVEAVSAQVTVGDGRPVIANVVGYDNETGFGLLQTVAPLKVRPLEMGKASDVKEGDPLLIASYNDQRGMTGVHVVSRREFTGNWEYMVDEAIFTAPADRNWSGAALLNHEGKLVGVGSLIVGDANGKGDGMRGNMFVPIDKLPPILGDLIADGRTTAAHPWLGVTTDDVGGHLVVSRVTPGAPAQKAGLRKGDIIVGVNGETPKDLSDFYRKVWAQGPAGTDVPLDVLQDHERRRIEVHSINRLDDLKLRSTF